MSETSSRFVAMVRPGDVLGIVLIVVSYILTFSLGMDIFTPLEIGILIAAGVVYALMSVYGAARCERSGSRLGLIAYFAIQISLGTTIFYLSEGRAWLVMLPLAGQAVDWLSRRWMLFVCALILVAMVAVAASFLASAVGPTGERLYPPGSGQFWLALLQSALPLAIALAFVVLFVQVAVLEREARAEVERLVAELGDANRQLREYAAQAEELATVKERNRLAREIHDSLGHYLTAIHMQLRAAGAVLERDPSVARDALGKAQGMAQQGLAEVRRSVATLRASPLENRSLSGAVGGLVDECRAAGIATEFIVRGEERALAPQAELALYRAAQEGLTNVRKHAQASSAEVTLDYRGDGSVRLALRDDGVGAEDPSGGYGLVGIRERVHLLGGEVHVETAPGEGFVLRVSVPG
jgi:signal transduction histidine kinase